MAVRRDRAHASRGRRERADVLHGVQSALRALPLLHELRNKGFLGRCRGRVRPGRPSRSALDTASGVGRVKATADPGASPAGPYWLSSLSSVTLTPNSAQISRPTRTKARPGVSGAAGSSGNDGAHCVLSSSAAARLSCMNTWYDRFSSLPSTGMTARRAAQHRSTLGAPKHVSGPRWAYARRPGLAPVRERTDGVDQLVGQRRRLRLQLVHLRPTAPAPAAVPLFQLDTVERQRSLRRRPHQRDGVVEQARAAAEGGLQGSHGARGERHGRRGRRGRRWRRRRHRREEKLRAKKKL